MTAFLPRQSALLNATNLSTQAHSPALLAACLKTQPTCRHTHTPALVTCVSHLSHCAALSQELLAEVKGHMTAYLPGYKVNEVAVSMWAMARLKGQPGLRLMAAALQHCFSQVRVRPAARLPAACGLTGVFECLLRSPDLSRLSGCGRVKNCVGVGFSS